MSARLKRGLVGLPLLGVFLIFPMLSGGGEAVVYAITGIGAGVAFADFVEDKA